MLDISKQIQQYLGYNGRMICMSKSMYRQSHPKNRVYFNACIFDKDANQIWWGDVDVTRDKRKIQKIANLSNQTLYLTPEHPFRTDFNKVTKELLESDEYVIKVVPKK